MSLSRPSIHRIGMGKTRAKKAQFRRARQEEQLVATIPLPRAGPGLTVEPHGEGGSEPWPTGTRVDPRTYAMAAGGRGTGWPQQGPATEAVPRPTRPRTYQIQPSIDQDHFNPRSGAEPNGIRLATIMPPGSTGRGPTGATTGGRPTGQPSDQATEEPSRAPPRQEPSRATAARPSTTAGVCHRRHRRDPTGTPPRSRP